ncbi:hypothetical protein F4556_007221 [Kitasatospora gansuensis]|uniref:Uncharacterized protein n=1 Tax=Kitasatospora gansuensis TaxID=258050 RepID=A0A7W7SLY1_9ACTN|nr:hypothetical protein [Kitasatospora gansuensis]MBB4951686.1 hypothetical protein [Kitasatospora gansuensis]
MKFLLEVDLNDPASPDDAAELGRILRYWAGNLKHYSLEPGSGEDVYDSAYRKVGQWSVTLPTADADGSEAAPSGPAA